MRKPVIAAAAAAVALGLGLTACGSGPDWGKGGGKDGTLVVGATAVPAGEVLAYVKDHLAARAGLKLEIKEFTDYVLPNTALQEGSLDANLYQNQPYLDDFNKSRGTDLVSVVKPYLPPMGVYSRKVEGVTGLADGATVAVPGDTTNEGRALTLLAASGVIGLKAGAGTDASPADVTSNPRHLKFKELEAAQLPRSLDDVDAAVINNNYAQDAGLSLTKDAILVESAKNNPYANLLAVRRGHENDPRVRKLAQLLVSPEVRAFIQDKYQGSVLPVTQS
ncbi:MetQ/NlpA family ABC transporter substrate-binding protein [Streptomyces sp. MMG1121]|uniref:MetQ/NlpA family ABC transporter substrate-binding protein n=1 Tax=Streptomyces sp. MMG1121 TaxID=1415544 RepID=UPI0006AE92A7|nr:MetQ/NlpA family ABC transporter substrate-binding protein [Streptomyces sp. MMG1121]KOV65754.1 metal ABC transporter substrate-binding protein [Streptomyces sp. MMG1121]